MAGQGDLQSMIKPPNGREGFAQPSQQPMQAGGKGGAMNPYSPNVGGGLLPQMSGYQNSNTGAGRFLQGQMYQPQTFQPRTYGAQQVPTIGSFLQTAMANIAAQHQPQAWVDPGGYGPGAGAGVDGTGIGIGVDGGNGAGGPAQGDNGGPGE